MDGSIRCCSAVPPSIIRRNTRAATANDRQTLTDMFAAARVAEVPSTTRVRVLDIGTVSEVRVLDGVYADRTAFVAYEFVE
jgi:hypothetical protein